MRAPGIAKSEPQVYAMNLVNEILRPADTDTAARALRDLIELLAETKCAREHQSIALR